MSDLPSSISTTPLPERWVEQLFRRMLLSYGKKFTDQWGGADTAELIAYWSMEMGGYSGQEIARGLKAMEARDWPPSLPEFKKMCRPPVDALKAYYEAMAGIQARAKGEFGTWSHPAVYWAAIPLSFDLGAQTYSQVKARWESALDEQLERGEWLEIPQPVLALSAPKKQTSRDEAVKALLNLKIEIKTPNSKIDHKLWARRIQSRAARGDKTLSLIQIQEATEALEAQEAT